MTSCQGGAVLKQLQSPSSSGPRCRVTFAEGEAPTTEERLKHDARVEMTFPLPPPMWQTKESSPEVVD